MSNKQPAHTITLAPWRGLSFGERFALEGASALLWPLQSDQRMTVLINLLAAQIDIMCEDEGQIDALLDLLRMQLKMMRPAEPDHDDVSIAPGLKPGEPGYVADRFYREKGDRRDYLR
jgi:hypothetical protein